ncbi:MAG: Rpn family recombination-promoting nuclease/putative transposase [Eubacterium sp.]
MIRETFVTNKEWADRIRIKNDVVFCTVFSDEKDCKELLQRILKIKIVKLRVVQNQKIFKNNIFQKGTRLDIYAEDDEGNVYDIEIQLTNTGELELRSRYYHSEMDGYQIRAGESYERLKQSIVIFLCDFDLFHKNQSVYTFEMRCNEEPSLYLEEKRKTIFVNLHGKRAGLSDKLRNLLDYLETSTPTDDFTKSIEKKVEEVKSDDEWRESFMTIEQKIKLEARVRAKAISEQECKKVRVEARAEGFAEGREEGREEGRAEGRAEGREEGREEGRAEGREEGAENNLLGQISKKLAKGKSIAQIADECEETEERIRELMKKL